MRSILVALLCLFLTSQFAKAQTTAYGIVFSNGGGCGFTVPPLRPELLVAEVGESVNGLLTLCFVGLPSGAPPVIYTLSSSDPLAAIIPGPVTLVDGNTSFQQPFLIKFNTPGIQSVRVTDSIGRISLSANVQVGTNSRSVPTTSSFAIFLMCAFILAIVAARTRTGSTGIASKRL
jgi:hypothetical protein